MKKKMVWSIGSILAILIVVIAWWLISPIFIDRVVDEALPGQETKQETKTEMTETTVEETMDGEIIVSIEPEELPPVMQNEYKGSFMDGMKNYKAEGVIFTVEADGNTYLRFEDFKTTNGPDLYIYLRKPETKTGDGINLGVLKGNEGNQNYELPEDIDLSEYSEVVIYCKAFSVDFGWAVLTN